jgi:hypothetical protein
VSEAKNSSEYPVHTPQFEGQAFEGLKFFPRPGTDDYKEWTEHIKAQVEIAEKSNIEKVSETEGDLTELMIQYKNFFLESRKEIEEQIEVQGREVFLKRLDSNLIKFADPNLGVMEFTTVDNEPVAKIIHEKSGVAFVIYDETKVSQNSKHFRKYLARISYKGGTGRKTNLYFDEDGKKRRIEIGRDQLIMGIRSDNTINGESIKLSPRLRGIKNYLRAMYKQPTAYDVRLGLTSGFAQYASAGALATALAMVLPDFGDGKSSSDLIAAFSFAYGSVIGIWSSFFHNWRAHGSPITQDLKNMSISLGYYVGVFLLSNNGVTQVTVTDYSFDPSQFLTTAKLIIDNPALMLAAAPAAHFFSNFTLNNLAKRYLYGISDVYSYERTDLDKVSLIWIPYPKKTSEGWKLDFYKTFDFRQRDLNRQFIYYLPLNWAKFIDQVWFGFTLAPTLKGEFPWWTPLVSTAGFAAFVAGASQAVGYWAHKHHPEAAKAVNIGQPLLPRIKAKCAELLTKLKRY